ncbi:unnamed protein product [Spirodela intermedia]|uniref:Uncharacterized protein n=1 Tax=Spirodela intermedia TaxID=51605 RepID=A0A7I8L3R8_SPIIN|nr:unnamed protein product [Spirodela intermedia]
MYRINHGRQNQGVRDKRSPEAVLDKDSRKYFETLHAISKLRNGKILPDPYREKREENNLEYEEKEDKEDQGTRVYETISSILFNHILEKHRYLRAPLITCEIRGMLFTRSLLDLGAIEFQLADGLIRQSYRILEDVIVKMESCYFHVDFIVADMKMNDNITHTPIILGRPFLTIAKTIMDWGKGMVELKFGHKKVEIKISKLIKYFENFIEDCNHIDLSDEFVDDNILCMTSILDPPQFLIEKNILPSDEEKH